MLVKDGLDITSRIEKEGIFANRPKKNANVSPFRKIGNSQEMSNEDPTGLSHYFKKSSGEYKDNVISKYTFKILLNQYFSGDRQEVKLVYIISPKRSYPY